MSEKLKLVTRVIARRVAASEDVNAVLDSYSKLTAEEKAEVLEALKEAD